MSNDENKVKEGHSYDGITEYDNPLPTWWLWTFFITIIFSFMYFLHYVVGSGPSLQDELKVAMQEIESNKAPAPALLETEETLTQSMQGAGIQEAGHAVYSSKCAACHGIELQGSIGPNLTDNYWIHGKATRSEILKVIREGVVEKGMPPWGSVLKKEELYSVTAYIFTRKGSRPQNPKAPQGDLIE